MIDNSLQPQLAESPVVSTVITSYNKGPYLAEAIESALAQDYAPHEIIVVDDGSIDNTQQVVDSFGDLVRYVHQENSGQSSAENHGIRTARGELIAFLDGDDRWRPSKLTKQVAVFRAHPETSVVYTRSWTFDHLTGRGVSVGSCRSVLPRGYVLDHLLPGNFVPFSSSMVRKECIERAGMFDESVHFGNDYDLWLRVAFHGGIFDYVDEELLEYRVGIDQFISRTSDAYYRSLRLQDRFVQRYFGGGYPTPRVHRHAKAVKCACQSDLHLGRGEHLRAFIAQAYSLRWNPLRGQAYIGLLRTLIPNWLVANVRSLIRADSVRPSMGHSPND